MLCLVWSQPVKDNYVKHLKYRSDFFFWFEGFFSRLSFSVCLLNTAGHRSSVLSEVCGDGEEDLFDLPCFSVVSGMLTCVPF